MDSEIAVPLFVAVLGVVGTLIGVVLTQRNANQREDLRWQREVERQTGERLHRVEQERTAWLREQRLIAYASLVRLASEFWTELVPLSTVLERQDDPDSELNRRRLALFDAINICQLLAGPDLQGALYALSDATENVGHRPYADDHRREQVWRRQLLNESQSAARELERVVRHELELPDKIPYTRAHWEALRDSGATE